MNLQPKPSRAGDQTREPRLFATKLFATKLLPGLVPSVHADTPAIGAFGAILAASVAATGAVLAAGIIATGAIGAAIINDDDEDKPDEPIIAPGTPPSQRRVGQQDLKPVFRGFVDRDIRISAASARSPEDDSDSVATVNADYALDGDVKLAPPRVERFTFRDRIVFRLEISDVKDANDVPMTFSVDSLTLSTIDVDGTDGHAEFSFTAVQDEQELWRWSAHVSQGKEPQVSSPETATHRIVRSQKDLLMVRKLRIPLVYTAPKAGTSTVIEVRMSSEGAGARV
ncbi:MAG: hypothetical protein ABI563_14310 [Specibacter sp.]